MNIITQTSKNYIRDLTFLGARVITPEIAAELLENNLGNRKLNKSRVKMYADDMRKGSWDAMPDGCSLVFDKNGNLLNGQHRLSAITMSGTDQEMFIFLKNIDGSSEQVVTDTGLTRSLALLTKQSSNYCSTMTSIIYNVMDDRRKISLSTFNQFQESFTESEKEFVERIGNYTRKGYSGVIKAGICLAYLLGETEKAEEFWNGITNLGTGVRYQKIREALISESYHYSAGGTRAEMTMRFYGFVMGYSSNKISTESFKRQTQELFHSLKSRFVGE